MPAFNIESCFGADIHVGYFDMEEILDILELKDKIVGSKRVQSLIKMHGRRDRIVSVAMRQVTFDVLRPVLDAEFLPYDPYFSHDKLLSSRRERLYDAQERFLLLCLSIANGRSVKSLKKLNPDLNTEELRIKHTKGQSLFRYFRQELNEQTREYILSYKARMEKRSADGSVQEIATSIAELEQKHTLSIANKKVPL